MRQGDGGVVECNSILLCAFTDGAHLQTGTVLGKLT